MQSPKEVPKGYLKPEEACFYLKVSDQTLRNWGRRGKIKTIQAGFGSHRRYNVREYLKEECGQECGQEYEEEKQNYIYCRVSTSFQKEDLK
jgi:excisionase family DNA binding protein